MTGDGDHTDSCKDAHLVGSGPWKRDLDNPDKRTFGPLLFQRIRDSKTGDEFVRRWGVRLGSCAVYLHHMLGPDPGRELHSHPWNAAFLILRGGYVEERFEYQFDGMTDEEVRNHSIRLDRWHRAGSVNVIRKEDYHRISALLGDTWTLGFLWGRGGDWGFWVPGKGHVQWQSYERSAP